MVPIYVYVCVHACMCVFVCVRACVFLLLFHEFIHHFSGSLVIYNRSHYVEYEILLNLIN